MYLRVDCYYKEWCDKDLKERNIQRVVLIHVFCIFPKNFSFEFDELNKLVPAGVFYDNQQILGVQDLVKITEVSVRSDLVKLILQLVKFIKKCPIDIKARLNLEEFRKIDFSNDTELSKLLLQKVLLDSEEAMQNLSNCITS